VKEYKIGNAKVMSFEDIVEVRMPPDCANAEKERKKAEEGEEKPRKEKKRAEKEDKGAEKRKTAADERKVEALERPPRHRHITAGGKG